MISAPAVPEPLAGIKVIDADTHLNEPYDLWTSRAPSAWRDRLPRIQEIDGEPTWIIDGQNFGTASKLCVVGRDGAKYDLNKKRETDHRGFRKMLSQEMMHPGAYQVEGRLQIMDQMGVWAQVVYPNLLGFGGIDAFKLAPDVREMSIKIFNDAMAEMQEQSKGRLFPMALVPWWDVDAAAAEARRAKAMGLRGINTNSEPNSSGLPDLGESALGQAVGDVCRTKHSYPVSYRRERDRHVLYGCHPMAVATEGTSDLNNDRGTRNGQRPGDEQLAAFRDLGSLPNSPIRLRRERYRMDCVLAGNARLPRE